MKDVKDVKDETTSMLKKVPTCQLVEELANREAVNRYYVDPYEPFEIKISGASKETIKDGPGIILFVYD